MPLKQKQSMTAFDIAAVTSSQQQLLEGALISNIYDSPFGGVLLKLKTAKGDLRIVAEPGQRYHATSIDVAAKGAPTSFVMGLRKRLRGSRIDEVAQLGFDRIVVVKTSSGNKLVVEVLPRGFLVLTGEDDNIVHVSEQREMRDRVLRRGVRYVPPPSRTLHPRELEASAELLSGLRGAAQDIVRGIVRLLGYPGEVVEEALARREIEPNTSTELLDKTSLAEVVNELRTIYEEALEGKGYILYGDEGPLTAVPFEPRGLVKRYKLRYKQFSDVNEALDEYFEILLRSRLQKIVGTVDAERARLEESIKRAEENIRATLEKIDVLKRRAELIGQHLSSLMQIHECVVDTRERLGWDYVVGKCSGVVDVEPEKGVYRVILNDDIVEFDIRLSPDRMLVELYRRIGELEAKVSRAQRTLSELKQKLEELKRESIIEKRVHVAVIRRLEWYEKYHWIITSSGLLAIGGRDASQNESIVKRYLGENDIYMHADIHGGASVVLLARGRMPPEKDLQEAAVLAAVYSKAWKAGMAAIDVYWVWGRQVSKAAPAGEYLVKGAFMVYGKKNYIRNVRIEIAIGMGVEEFQPVIIVGPEDLVRRRSVVYAVLVPGEEDPSRTAKRLKKIFERHGGEYQAYARALTIDEIRLRVPGPSRIIRVSKGEGVERPRPLRGSLQETMD